MTKKATVRPFIETLQTGNVSFFGYLGSTPRIVHEKKQGRVRTFVRAALKQKFPDKEVYGTIGEIREQKSDVYFLDHEAEKALLSDFPASAHYICLPVVPHLVWGIALPGLLRRLLIGLVKIEGIKKMENIDGTFTLWLVLRHLLTETLHTRLSLSQEIGIQRFLDYLKEEKLQYVVLRFFEKLPELYREGGDLDLLVSDNDERAVKEFLQLHPGTIGVDVWTASRTTFNDVTYYPPPIAKKIIEHSIEGPAGARIPRPKDAFLALAYHVVYHKGTFAGVPSSIKELAVNANPENDYRGVLERMAKELGIEIEITMETLDEYLAHEGWRPHLDTLAKIAPKNKWIWYRFFSATKKHVDEIGLSVVILKQKAISLGLVDAIIHTIETNPDFILLKTKRFSKEEVEHISSKLRGGVWHGPNGEDENFLPACALLVLNIKQARLSYLGVTNIDEQFTIRGLKKNIRKKYDVNGGSLIHATDNTREAWEYIPVCFPGEGVENIVARNVAEYKPSSFMLVMNWLTLMPRMMVYKATKIRRKVRDSIISMLLKV